MAPVTAKMVQELREKTGAGMLDCKKALTEADGNMDSAVKLLREKGLAAAANRQSKTAAEGIVKVKLSDSLAVITEVNSETDFVSRNEGFLDFAEKITEHIFNKQPEDLESLKKQKFGDSTVNEELSNFIAKIGENIKVRRFDIFKAGSDECMTKYIHGNGKIGVIVKIKLSDASKKSAPEIQELIKDLSMQIAAAEPKYINSKEVTKAELDNEREIYSQQMRNEGKPEQIIAKIVEGKLSKYYELVCLIDQLFIKDTTLKVKTVIANVEKSCGVKIEVTGFVRYKVGEGIEKKKTDFAAEVEAQLNQAK
ncbi:MAG TPA: translation elongation factor Ts [bacterium]|nr:translation elongation factor Ts [bacterium]HPN30270.1 translation elongation factor Ts [bacterium]